MMGESDFGDYMQSVITHLHARLAGEPDEHQKDVEKLKAKKLLFMFCFGEVTKSAYEYSPQLGATLETLQGNFTEICTQYERLIKRIREISDVRVSNMREDVQHAANEIEVLMKLLNNDEEERGSLPHGGLRVTLGHMKSENAKINEKIKLLENTRHKLMNIEVSKSQLNGSVMSDDGASTYAGSPSESTSAPLNVEALKDIINEVYTSKIEYDKHCTDHRLPKETPLTYLRRFLETKFGKHPAYSVHSVQVAVARLSSQDIDVSLFGKILRNEVDEDFIHVHQNLKETIKDLLRENIRQNSVSKSDDEVARVLRRKVNGDVQESECTEIIKYLYNVQDSNTLIALLKEDLKKRNKIPNNLNSYTAGNGRVPRSYHSHPAAKAPNILPYSAFVKLVCEFQLQGHERYLAPFVHVFQLCDSDKDGVLSAHEFIDLIMALDDTQSDGQARGYLINVDPQNSGRVVFSDAVSFMSQKMNYVFG